MHRIAGALALASGLAMGWSGCFIGGARQAYHLRQQVLYPPQRAKPSERPSRSSLRLLAGTGCGALRGSFSNPALGLEWTLADRRLTIVLWPAISNYGASTPVALLNGIHALHEELDAAVARGCLAPATEQTALQRAVESGPLAPRMAQVLVLGDYAAQKYIDIADPVELQLTYALRSDAPGRYDLGYAVQTYRLIATTADGRGRLERTASEVKNAPGIKRARTPPVAITTGAAGYYRLFFYLRRSAADHDVALLEADDHAALERATAVLLSQPRLCGRLETEGARCVLVPPDDGLDARLRVRLQGRTTTVPVTATVGGALEDAGIHDLARVLPTLQVLHPYGSGYAPVEVDGPKTGLLQMTLCGGESIRW